MKKLVSFLAVVIFCVPAALLSRHAALLSLLEHDIKLIGNFIELTLVKNTGAAFGIFAGNTKMLSLTTGLIIFAILVYVIVYRNKIKILETISLALICAGGLCNLYERIAYGYVIDYINIQILPVFNVADICVTCGCILFVLIVIFEPKKAKNE